MEVSLVVVGDEILSGNVPDENVAFLGARLTADGNALGRVSVVPDEPAAIAAQIRADIGAGFTLIITSGGLGPTHDDRTVEGVALALGVGTTECAPLAEVIGTWVDRAARGGVGAETLGVDWLRKMALAPDGASLLQCSRAGIPAFHVRDVSGADIVILPGPPWMFRLVVDETVRTRFAPPGEPPHLEEVSHGFPESSVAAVLDALAREHPMVSIGSYPREDGVLVRFRGPRDHASAAAGVLRAHLDDLAATVEGSRLLGGAHR